MKKKIRDLFKRIYKTTIVRRLVSLLPIVALSSVFLSGVFIYEVHINNFFVSKANLTLGILGVFVGISTMLYAVHIAYKRS